jgi:ParB/RepB/Spo0J family partition protein
LTQLKNIDPQKVEMPKYDFRYARNAKFFELFLQDANKNGIRTPIIVTPHPTDPDKYILLDGYTRLTAARTLHHDTIQALVLPQKNLDPVEENIMRNIWQADVGPISFAQALEYLCKKYQNDFYKVAEMVGITEKHVRNYLKLLSLPENIKLQIERGERPAFKNKPETSPEGNHFPPSSKTGYSSQKCLICGKWPPNGQRKWLLFCSEHETELQEITRYILAGEYKKH